MVTGVSENSTVVQAPTVHTAPAASASAAPTINRATAPDTATISAAGQQASHDVDHDGDSH